MVAARRAVAAEKLGRRGAEEVGERLKPGEPRARAALFPIADRGDGNAEPAGEVGLAEPPVPAQPSQPVRSEERRGGQECFSTCRSRRSQYPLKKKDTM